MLFNSLHFFIFFLLVTISYFLLPHRFRWALLLISSCYFYMVFKPIYILILGFTIVIDYFAGIYLEESQGKTRKWYLIASLIANVGVLAIFKYYNFLNLNFSLLLSGFDMKNPLPFLEILLPIGLSFHTFQAMSYTIEVYRGNQKAERNFGIYALYVMFYPQLVAGPIERPQNVIHQFYEKHEFDYQRFVDGIKMMIWGLMKKVVIADRLAVYVNEAYNNPNDQSTASLILATYFFAIQIYCDFSGYSDMALGSAWVMGYDLMENFRTPYISKNIKEFWARWHISLSSWFRDYLYIPLGGNRVAKWRWNFNLFFVFMVSGIWHGANWTYIVWGTLHGAYLVGENLLDDVQKRWNLNAPTWYRQYLQPYWKWFITFHLAVFAWIFFRANSLTDAGTIIDKILIHPQLDFASIKQAINGDNTTPLSIALALLFLLIDPSFDVRMKSLKKQGYIPYSRWIFAFIVAVIAIFGYFGFIQFIYFQF
ncbi:MAG: MBOAT family O-acyltransferase [Bacteroidia bacterium]